MTVPRSLPMLPPSCAAPAPARPPPRAVRISITDRCDLACVYCRPSRRDGYLPRSHRLAPEAWATLVGALAAKGIRRVRITGGEPLVHPHVVEIVRSVASVPGIEDVALTTNGTRLKALAGPLRRAGLLRVNVSLDSLSPGRFFRLTRGGRLGDVLDGLRAARAQGFHELKTNTVVLRGENEHEITAITRWAWAAGATPRFLELMGVGQGAALAAFAVPHREIRARLAGIVHDGEPTACADRGPARYLRSTDGKHRVGFITGASDSFCAGCDRLRVTADGRLRPCLATTGSVDVSGGVRGEDARAIGRGVDDAWAMKPDGARWRGCAEIAAGDVDMCATGG